MDRFFALLATFILGICTKVVSPEIQTFSESAISEYFQNLIDDSKVSENCRISLKNEGNLSESRISAFAVGDYATYKHVEHSRWIHKSLACAKAAGGSMLVEGPERFEFCYGEVNSSYIVGVCLPNSCKPDGDEAVERWFEQTQSSFSKLKKSVNCLASRWEKQWYQKTVPLIDTLLQVSLYIVTFGSTILDFWWRKKGKVVSTKCQQTLVAWSLKANFPKLYALPKDPKAMVSCLFGLRFISMVWMLIGHSYLILLPFLADLEPLKRDLSGFLAQIVTNFTLCVDTFFLLSGTVTAYSWFRRQQMLPDDQQATWKSWGYWLKFYRHRLIRLWPAYAYILFTTSVRYGISHYHQNFPTIDPTEQCRDHWWQNLLFLNSIYPNRCMPWLWYLGNDFIFYLVSPIFLLLLRWRIKLGCAIITILCAISCAIRFYIAKAHNFPPTQFLWIQPEIFNPDFISHHLVIYIKPHTRYGPYLVGLLLGYFLQNSKKAQANGIPLMVQLLCWFLSVCGALWAVFGLYPALLGWNWYMYNLMFTSIHRTIFALAVAWVVYACHTGHAVLINKGLSSRVWLFFGNLSYGCYLFHAVLIGATYLNSEFPMKWRGHLHHVLYILGQWFLSYFCGLVINLWTEIPFINLERIFLTSKPQLQKSKSSCAQLCLTILDSAQTGFKETTESVSSSENDVESASRTTETSTGSAEGLEDTK